MSAVVLILHAIDVSYKTTTILKVNLRCVYLLGKFNGTFYILT